MVLIECWPAALRSSAWDCPSGPAGMSTNGKFGTLVRSASLHCDGRGPRSHAGIATQASSCSSSSARDFSIDVSAAGYLRCVQHLQVEWDAAPRQGPAPRTSSVVALLSYHWREELVRTSAALRAQIQFGFELIVVDNAAIQPTAPWDEADLRLQRAFPAPEGPAVQGEPLAVRAKPPGWRSGTRRVHPESRRNDAHRGIVGSPFRPCVRGGYTPRLRCRYLSPRVVRMRSRTRRESVQAQGDNRPRPPISRARSRRAAADLARCR